MATARRRPHPALIERLLAAPAAFDFFQAVRVLELETAARAPGGAARALDLDRPPSELGLRFRAATSLAFPVHALAAARAVESAGDGVSGFELEVACLGLIGAAGTLPRHYTVALLERLQLKDPTLREFLDLLQHRTLVLFYRAGCKYRIASAHEAPVARTNAAADPVLEIFLSLIGLGARAAAAEVDPLLAALAHHSGHFANRRRSAEGLRAMLSGLLRCSVRVEQFLGEWVELDLRSRSRLGRGAGPGAQARLGEETTLGTRVWTVDSRVRVVAGPLDRQRFCELWPGSPKLRLLEQLTHAYLGPLIDFEFVWELAANAPAIQRLGSDQRLGRDAWLGWSDVARADVRVASPPGQNRAPSRS